MFWGCPRGNRAQECKRRPEKTEKTKDTTKPVKDKLQNHISESKNINVEIFRFFGFFRFSPGFSGPRLHDSDGPPRSKKQTPHTKMKTACFQLACVPDSIVHLAHFDMSHPLANPSQSLFSSQWFLSSRLTFVFFLIFGCRIFSPNAFLNSRPSM